MRNKVCEYYNDTYESTTYLVIGTSRFAKKWMIENIHIDDNEVWETIESKAHAGCAFEFTNADGSVFCNVIYMPELVASPSSLSTLYHEIFHVCCNIMLGRCIPVERENNEAMAYIISAMSKYFLENTHVLRNQKKGKK